MHESRNRRQRRVAAAAPNVGGGAPLMLAWATALLLVAGVLLVQPGPVSPHPDCVTGSAGRCYDQSHPQKFGTEEAPRSAEDKAERGRQRRGLVDKPERGKTISDRVTAKELYEAYSQIKNEYEERAFTVADEESCGSTGACWRILKETSDDIQIAMLQHPSDPSCPYVRMRAVMPGTVQDVWDFLALSNWERTMPKMDPFYEGLSVLQQYTHQAADKTTVDIVLARKHTKRILTFGKRDFTFVSVSDVPRSDGVWVSGTVSVVTHKLPRVTGYTRAFQDSVAFYEPLEPDPNTGDPRTALTIVCRIDLNDSGEGGEGGAVPMWIYVKTIGTSGALSIHNMRKELEKEAAERKLRDEQQKSEESDTRCPLVPWVAGSKGSRVASESNKGPGTADHAPISTTTSRVRDSSCPGPEPCDQPHDRRERRWLSVFNPSWRRNKR